MKSFQEFQEETDAAQAALRKARVDAAREEASARTESGQKFTQTQREKSKSLRRKALERLEALRQKAKELKAKREQQKQVARQKAAHTAHGLKTAAKATVQAGKTVVGFVRNRMRNRGDSQEN